MAAEPPESTTLTPTDGLPEDGPLAPASQADAPEDDLAGAETPEAAAAADAQPSKRQAIVGKRSARELIEAFEAEQLKQDLPEIFVGDTVKVGVRIREGNKERIQPYEGVVIAMRHGGLNATITVRRIFQGIGVERVFMLKLRCLIRDIVDEQIFGPVLAYVFRVEWQARGLPHAHMLIILEDKILSERQVDAVISAEMPDAAADADLQDLVATHMLHVQAGITVCCKVAPQVTVAVHGATNTVGENDQRHRTGTQGRPGWQIKLGWHRPIAGRILPLKDSRGEKRWIYGHRFCSIDGR
jgi:large subunit ribosomal protein L19